MARKTTTKAFREHAVYMVRSGMSTVQVAKELDVEHHKVQRWCKNSDDALMFSTLLDTHKAGIEEPSPTSGGTPKSSEKEIKNLQRENRHLRELVQLSTQWISTYVAMQGERQLKS
ncbi:transposase [Sansalvadorimonas sp. 2012CJ34-2]|uniref:Transposase n=1 Tax=Parendozoicomonas callyspongiae TaxID=2942213 RepID=A0ABT0PJD6_9GAMM|nr:helix-turn-helix domain-containing protein [Sansalvadorimonas sp. 2012CJ34-2]MCL6271473.1 transposase [Sansalvadorimonas sp. 2012CJ34-2]